MVRTAEEMAAIVAGNPFAHAPGEQLVAICLQHPPPAGLLADVKGQSSAEEIRLGTREIYVWYGGGIGASKLRIQAAKDGTARNMNTLARLAAMAAE
jgi:uncharacterized protein (DUF1697 family)